MTPVTRTRKIKGEQKEETNGDETSRGDVVPRVSYAGVEAAFLELVNASPMRNAAASIGRRFTETLGSLKARPLKYAPSVK